MNEAQRTCNGPGGVDAIKISRYLESCNSIYK